MMEFVPLRIHTRFSPLLSLIEPKELPEALRRLGYDRAGIVDRGTLFGALEARCAFAEEGIALVAGAEVVVRFSRPGGGLPPPAYTIVLYPESEEGWRNLALLLERIGREDRPPRLQGIADFEEVAERCDGLIVMSGGMTGPVSGAFARGRVGDARRITASLAELFGAGRFFLETTRRGGLKEALVEPFIRGLARRHGLRLVAADPVRTIGSAHAPVLRAIHAAGGGPTAEDPPDPFLLEGAGDLVYQKEMARLYADDEDPLCAAAEIAERNLAGSWAGQSSVGDGKETSDLIRIAFERMKSVYATFPHWRRKEIEDRFWNEFWRIGEKGGHRPALGIAALFRTIRRAVSGAEIQTDLLSGSVVGHLLRLQDVDPVEKEIGSTLPAPDIWESGFVVEGDFESASLFRRLVLERHGDSVFPVIEPRHLPGEARERLMRELGRLPGEDSGPEPHPPTAQPSGRRNRGNRGPDPLSEVALSHLLEKAIVRYERSERMFDWVNDPVQLWVAPEADEPTAGRLRFRLLSSNLLETLRATREVGEGDATATIRRGDWTGILMEGKPVPFDLVRSFGPHDENDLALLLSVGMGRGPRRDLLERIAGIRSGDRPSPAPLPRLAAVLRETGGIPFYQEQIVEAVHIAAGYPRERARTLLSGLRLGKAEDLAQERSPFLRRAVDRGLSIERAEGLFSMLVALTPHAPRRGEVMPYARRLWTAASRKNADPERFAASALNAARGNLKRLHDLITAFTGESVCFLPLDLNRSRFGFGVETGGVRLGLALIPGMTSVIASRIEVDREERGTYENRAELLQRLASIRVPRPVLEKIGEAFRGDRPVPGDGSSLPLETGRVRSRSRGSRVSGRGRTGSRGSRKSRQRGKARETQTAFAFFRRSDGGQKSKGSGDLVESDGKEGR